MTSRSRYQGKPKPPVLALPPLNLDAGLPGLPGPRPWKCEIVMCLHKPGWWLSRHGVLNCLNCCPPSSPDLVVRRGTNEDAPLVTVEQSRTPIDWSPPTALGPGKPARKPRKSSPKRVAS